MLICILTDASICLLTLELLEHGLILRLARIFNPIGSTATLCRIDSGPWVLIVGLMGFQANMEINAEELPMFQVSASCLPSEATFWLRAGNVLIVLSGYVAILAVLGCLPCFWQRPPRAAAAKMVKPAIRKPYHANQEREQLIVELAGPP